MHENISSSGCVSVHECVESDRKEIAARHCDVCSLVEFYFVVDDSTKKKKENNLKVKVDFH